MFACQIAWSGRRCTAPLQKRPRVTALAQAPPDTRQQRGPRTGAGRRVRLRVLGPGRQGPRRTHAGCRSGRAPARRPARRPPAAAAAAAQRHLPSSPAPRAAPPAPPAPAARAPRPRRPPRPCAARAPRPAAPTRPARRRRPRRAPRGSWLGLRARRMLSRHARHAHAPHAQARGPRGGDAQTGGGGPRARMRGARRDAAGARPCACGGRSAVTLSVAPRLRHAARPPARHACNGRSKTRVACGRRGGRPTSRRCRRRSGGPRGAPAEPRLEPRTRALRVRSEQRLQRRPNCNNPTLPDSRPKMPPRAAHPHSPGTRRTAPPASGRPRTRTAGPPSRRAPACGRRPARAAAGR